MGRTKGSKNILKKEFGLKDYFDWRSKESDNTLQWFVYILILIGVFVASVVIFSGFFGYLEPKVCIPISLIK
jgi:hypothetical protein